MTERTSEGEYKPESAKGKNKPRIISSFLSWVFNKNYEIAKKDGEERVLPLLEYLHAPGEGVLQPEKQLEIAIKGWQANPAPLK